MTIDPNSLIVQQGTSTTAQLSVRSVNGYSGTVNLATYVPFRPYGTSESFSSSTIALSPGVTVYSTITIMTDYTTPDSYAITVTGADGSKSYQLTIPVWVSTPPPPPPTYVYPATFTGSNVFYAYDSSHIIVCDGSTVSVRITLSASQTFRGPVSAEVRKHIFGGTDQWKATLSRTVGLNSGNNAIDMGSFGASDVTGPDYGDFRHYFIKVFWAGQEIYNPTEPNNREWVEVWRCGGGGGGGSVMEGTHVTRDDGSKAPIQNLLVGDRIQGYNRSTGEVVIVTILESRRVMVDNLVVIRLEDGTVVRTDNNPLQKFWVRSPSGFADIVGVPYIQVGDHMFNVPRHEWVQVVDKKYVSHGNYSMYDLMTDDPGMGYIVEDILDPTCKACPV